jgi:hypothetical protein
VPRPKRLKIVTVPAELLNANEGPSQAASSTGAIPTPSPPQKRKAGRVRTPSRPDHRDPIAGAAGGLNCAGAGDQTVQRGSDGKGAEPGAEGSVTVPAVRSENAEAAPKPAPNPAKNPAKVAGISLDTPDMRAVGTWVIRHLETDDPMYAAPDPMAVTLLEACKNDPKFKATFIGKVFDRMMVQDQATTQTKFTDDNKELRSLLDALDVSAKVANA